MSPAIILPSSIVSISDCFLPSLVILVCTSRARRGGGVRTEEGMSGWCCAVALQWARRGKGDAGSVGRHRVCGNGVDGGGRCYGVKSGTMAAVVSPVSLGQDVQGTTSG